MLDLDRIIADALTEDIGHGDLTVRAVVPKGTQCRAELVARDHGVLSGIGVFQRVFDRVSRGEISWTTLEDGAVVAPNTVIAEARGPAAMLLRGERVALNFVQRLSGVATMTARFVEAVKGTGVRIVDTRKTTPLLRALEKRAVRHGGGANHRFGLFDALLIKENHIVAAGGVAAAMAAARLHAPHTATIEIEVEDLAEFDEALAERPTTILLDNMSLEDMREAARRANGSGVLLEASGDMTLDRVRAVAETGVQLISVGALTHSAPALNLSLRLHHD